MGLRNIKLSRRPIACVKLLYCLVRGRIARLQSARENRESQFLGIIRHFKTEKYRVKHNRYWTDFSKFLFCTVDLDKGSIFEKTIFEQT